MKKLLVLILVLAAGYVAYQKFVVRSLTDEQKQVQALADDFAAVKQQMAQAETSAGATGMDMTSDVDTAMGGAEAVLKKLQELKENLKEEKSVEMANTLEAELQAFLNRK
jgi:hypothetical protein